MGEEIRCPHCGYDGGDASERNPVEVTATGVPRVLCGRCGRYFTVRKFESERVQKSNLGGGGNDGRGL